MSTQEIRERWEKVTPGEWTARRYGGHDSEVNDWPGDIVALGTKIFAGPFSFRALQGRTPEEAEANAIAIAAAPADIATLLQRVSELEELLNVTGKLGETVTSERDRYKAALEEIKGTTVGEAEDVKYVQASQWHQMKDIATRALEEPAP